jgi:hypothetical protein
VLSELGRLDRPDVGAQVRVLHYVAESLEGFGGVIRIRPVDFYEEYLPDRDPRKLGQPSGWRERDYGGTSESRDIRAPGGRRYGIESRQGGP